MYPKAIFEGFEHGLINRSTAGGVPYNPWTEPDPFSDWFSGFNGARDGMEDGRTAAAMRDPIKQAQYIAFHLRLLFAQKNIAALCFQKEGYRRIYPKSYLDGVPEACPECGDPMVMSAFEKDTPGGPRPTSYRVVGMCVKCFYFEEF